MKNSFRVVYIVFLTLVLYQTSAIANEMVHIPKGEFQSFFKGEGSETVKVPSFYLDKYLVTNLEFNKFLVKHHNFRKSKIPRLFADEYYLRHWQGELLTANESKKISNMPVTNVPWFMARRYCESQGKRLPSIVEWEYASDGDDSKNQKVILEWYGVTSADESIVDVKNTLPNKFGVYGMHGVVWEHVDDFLKVMISSDSRSKGDRTNGLFCGGGSLSSRDSSKYATFMRYAYRSGLKGNYSGQNLGFRCAK